jgi:hypothetical protein
MGTVSYEGREEHLCGNGHRWTIGCTYMSSEVVNCPHCQTPSVWAHGIDDTNCDSVGEIPDTEWAKFQLTSDVYVTCDHGFPHLKEAATYRIPTEDELRNAEHYWDGQTYVRLNR